VKKKPNGEAKKLRTPAYRPRRTPTKAEKLEREARNLKELTRALHNMNVGYDDSNE
jgi:hypothetical protein